MTGDNSVLKKLKMRRFAFGMVAHEGKPDGEDGLPNRWNSLPLLLVIIPGEATSPPTPESMEDAGEEAVTKLAVGTVIDLIGAEPAFSSSSPL